MADHARMWNRTKKANVTSQEKCQVFRRQRGGGLQGRTVGSWSPHVLTPVTQHRCDTGSLGTEQHPLHGERLKNHLAQSREVKVGYFVIGSKGMYKQEFFWPSWMVTTWLKTIHHKLPVQQASQPSWGCFHVLATEMQPFFDREIVLAP